jgi:DNA-binding MarR family transcriptional regulator
VLVHAIFFGIKRVHLRVLALTRRMVDLYGLTPARFELLRIVHLQPDGIAQSTLRWLLGVAAPTVSKMLKSLEDLGIVGRARDPRDARCLIVRLTRRGLRAVTMARFDAVDRLEAEFMAARGVLGDPRDDIESGDEFDELLAAGRAGVDDIDRLLTNMRRAFADPAPFRDPWRSAPFTSLVFTTLVDGRCRYGDHDPFATVM